MSEFLWHLLYITVNCAVAIIVWENRFRIQAWWGANAESRARVLQRLKDLVK